MGGIPLSVLFSLALAALALSSPVPAARDETIARIARAAWLAFVP